MLGIEAHRAGPRMGRVPHLWMTVSAGRPLVVRCPCLRGRGDVAERAVLPDCPPDARGVAEREEARQGGGVIWRAGGRRPGVASEAALFPGQQPGPPLSPPPPPLPTLPDPLHPITPLRLTAT